MAETFNKMKIDVTEEINDIITEVQADQNSRYLDVYLYNNGVPIDLTDHTVRIYMCRPKTEPLEEIFNDGEITDATAGRCQFLLTTQALAKVGYLEMQITIWKGTEQILSTHAFKIMVTKNLMSDGSVEASNEYGALVVLFQNLYEAMDLMTEMVQNIGVPAEVAAKYDLTTMWQCWEFLVDYMKGDFTDKVDEAIANASVKGVLDRIGETADSGGNVMEGTVFAKLNNLIDSGKELICTASNNVLLTPVISEKTGDSDNTSICQLKVNKMSGTLRVTVSFHGHDGSNATVNVTGATGGSKEMHTSSASYQTQSVDIIVADGDVIQIRLYALMYYCYANLVTISGDLSELQGSVPGISVV